jgi:serine/threonine protein kinase/tetratricopeptide (TPR) repeat protein
LDPTTSSPLSPDPQEACDREPSKPWPTISSYEILDVIREGGMGVVYRARQRGLNRLVALKMIRGDRARPDHFARFRTEAEAVAQLRHPNVIQIHEIGETDGLPFLSLELMEGGTLEDRLAGTPQPGRQAAALLVTLARAVQVAHGAGIIHRDLKPSNVLFSEEGVPKVTDFGLAKRLDSDSRQTETGQIMGTPCYMAPEQAKGHTRDVGPAADIYALGSILYEMLTGRPPFKGETSIETVRQVVEDEVVPPSRLVPRIPKDLETICLYCLYKQPSRRYGSALALAEDLERFLAGRPIKARRTPLLERAGKLILRHPVAATLLTVGLIGTLGSGGAWLHSSAIKREQEIQRLQRDDVLKSTVLKSLFRAEDLVASQNWTEAEPILTEVQAKIDGVHNPGDLPERVSKLLDQVRRGKAEQAAKSQDQQKLRAFRERRKEVVFHETHFTGLDLPYKPETVRDSALNALAVFSAPGGPESVELGPLPRSLTPREHEEIKEGCYELLLVLSEAEEPERGLRHLDQAARLQPHTRAYHLRRADCLARRGDAAGAQREHREAEALPSTSALDFFLIGKEMYKREDWAGALPNLDAALLRQPEHFWAHCLSSICDMRLGRPIQAKAELNACLQAEPGFAWLYELRAFASYQIAGLARNAVEGLQARGSTLRNEIQLQLQAAEKDYARALELLDDAPNKTVRYALLVNRSLLWTERREWHKAAVDLHEAIRLDDQRWQAIENLAQVFLKQDKPDQAIEQFTRAIALRPGWAPLYRARAAANQVRKEPTPAHRAAALADLEEAIRLEPAKSTVLALDHTSRAKLLHQESRVNDALSACDAALEIDPTYIDAHRLRIELLRKLKRYDDVVRSCDALLTRGKPSAELYEFRGLAKEKLKDYQGAIEDQTLAIALHPGSAALLARRGALHLVTDAPRSALRDFQQAMNLDATNADALLGRGLALAAQGQHREATADAAKALRMGEPTAVRLYNAARIHAQAAIAAATEARKRGQNAVSQVIHYQDQALRLLAEWHKRLPASERSSALRDLIQDPAMATLRRRLRSLELTGAMSPSGG